MNDAGHPVGSGPSLELAWAQLADGLLAPDRDTFTDALSWHPEWILDAVCAAEAAGSAGPATRLLGALAAREAGFCELAYQLSAGLTEACPPELRPLAIEVGLDAAALGKMPANMARLLHPRPWRATGGADRRWTARTFGDLGWWVEEVDRGTGVEIRGGRAMVDDPQSLVFDLPLPIDGRQESLEDAFRRYAGGRLAALHDPLRPEKGWPDPTSAWSRLVPPDCWNRSEPVGVAVHLDRDLATLPLPLLRHADSGAWLLDKVSIHHPHAVHPTLRLDPSPTIVRAEAAHPEDARRSVRGTGPAPSTEELLATVRSAPGGTLVVLGHLDENDGRPGLLTSDGIAAFEDWFPSGAAPRTVVLGCCTAARPPCTADALDGGPAEVLLSQGVEWLIGSAWPLPVVSGVFDLVDRVGMSAGRGVLPPEALRSAQAAARGSLPIEQWAPWVVLRGVPVTPTGDGGGT